MFLVGTALVVFGIGLFAMFVGSEKMKEKNRKWISRSNLFGLFYMKVIRENININKNLNPTQHNELFC